MNPKSNWQPRKYHLPRDFTLKQLLHQVDLQISNRSQYDVLKDYYLGKQDILNRTFSDPTKPNNRIANNIAKLIVDTNASYFMGNPITYTAKNMETVKKVGKFLAENDARDVDSELAKICSMMGHAFEFHWIDKEGRHRFKYTSPDNVLAIYSADLDEDLLVAVNISITKNVETNEDIIYLEIYSEDTIDRYKYIRGGEATLIQSKPHPFGEVPVIEYIANDERQSDFEGILSMIDAYDKITSDAVNEIEAWGDSYLLLRDLQATTTEDIQEMKANRVLMVDGTGDASFLERKVNDKHVQNMIDILTRDIHKFAQTPNLSDEQFATNLSGTAIRYKMLTLENRTASRERKFTTSLMKRLRLIFHTLKLRGEELVDDMTPIFVRNLPANITELADTSIKLKGIVSDETLRSQLPFIIDLDKEAELVKKQKEEELEFQVKAETSMSLLSDPLDNGTGNNGMNTHNTQRKKSNEGDGE